jgi:hypothetical protein
VKSLHFVTRKETFWESSMTQQPVFSAEDEQLRILVVDDETDTAWLKPAVVRQHLI